ncbi:baseplate multidomain protein megatron [Enterovirga sp. CN4-39]|uniref:baseplate multidomain protein megatron n=1 Tax=Enterovirga sp. CN4-39 TaxID=3400910 RepID=UPI003C024EB5
MTTLVLQAADTALGGLARVGTSYLGGLVAGAISGSGGRNTTRAIEGPRLTEMNGLASTEGAPIPRVYGRARVGGQLIWATRFEEVANTAVDRQTSRGGKSLGSSRRTTTTVTTTYSYHANLAVGLCEGPIAFVRRIWADGRELDQTNLTIRVHPGTEDQVPDPLIVANEGAENAPAYRGLAYAVFEKLPLAEFGNRVPQLTFEVVRPAEGLRNMIRSVCLIPGAGEFAYETVPTRRELGLGSSVPENTHQFARSSDVVASLDQLQALCPNLKHVSLVVSWFGSDLRAGHCTVTPRVEIADKATSGFEWSVAGLTRAEAGEVSHSAGRPAYGGTPSDASVVRLVQALKARGLAVTLYPFVMMDIPAGNDLPDPRTGAAGQPPYPWRGRITCDPAPGLPGTVDATSAAAEQVAAFFGSAEEWGLRRVVHHYADLAAEAGGVDGFIIGSELVGLTRIRSAPGVYPGVDHLRALAGEVRAKLGPETRITYAADWTEYGAHVLDGGAEVRFPLDPLWADPAIDAVGIDNYAPISDWRDGVTNADAALGRSIHDRDYLRGRLRSGETFDWHYASEADRLAQVRTPIMDGAYGKPWIFRAKDFAGWWENHHVERSTGVETGTTAWVPRSKPIWLTEIGIPAVDKGPNGPNVFPDPKSVESAVPPFSSGARDDLVQVRALEAMLSGFDPAIPGHVEGANPSSPLYGGPMIDHDRVSVWAWDARPFPAFPDLDLVWADGANWETGHWITGRIEGVPLDRLVRAIMADYGLDGGPDIPLDGFVDGYVIDRPMSARQALEPLADVFGFDAIASGGAIRWQGRDGRSSTALLASDLVESGNEPVFARSRAQETDLPAAVELNFTDGEGEYGRAAAGSRRLAGTSRREVRVDSAIVTRRAEAQRLADIRLQDEWAGRETASFALSPRRLDLEPGDIVEMEGPGGPMLHRIVRIADGASRKVEARELDPSIFNAPRPAGVLAPRRPAPPSIAGRPAALLLDLPASPADPAALQHLAVAADPWPGAIAVWRSLDGGSFSLHAVAHLPAVVGQTTSPVPAGPVWVFDRASVIEAEFSAAALSSIGEEGALGFDSLFAVQGLNGTWEMFSAAFAELIGPRRYRLSGLLRGPDQITALLHAAILKLSDEIAVLKRRLTTPEAAT